MSGGPATEIDAGQSLSALTFSVDGKYVWSGGHEEVVAWQAEDGQRIAILEAKLVQSLAVSRDGRLIAAGTWRGSTSIWDTVTREQVLSHQVDDENINGVDFSPDSTRLVTASWRLGGGKVVIWDIATRKQALTLNHEDSVRAVKYSPQGDLIATATRNFVRVYDNNRDDLLMKISVKVTPRFNTGLIWSNGRLLVISESMIKRYDARTGSMVAEWPVPRSNKFSCIALPKHEKFIVYSTECTVSFWNLSTHTQLDLFQHSHDIHSITISPDDRLLGICGKQERIIINDLSRIIDGVILLPLHPAPRGEDISIVPDSPIHSHSRNAGSLSPTVLAESSNPTRAHADEQAHLMCFDEAISDAKPGSGSDASPMLLLALPGIGYSPPPDLTPHITRTNSRFSAGGHFGDVYRCYYHGGSIPQEVAVKAFRFTFTAEDSTLNKSVKMLRRELGIWRRLKHDNIVPFLGIAFGFGMDGTMSLVSLWMPNECLLRFLTRYDDDLRIAHRLKLLLDIANGLHYLHSFSIVHGDLNSNNVLMDEDYTARLGDFGYSSLVGEIPEALAYLQRSTTQTGALRWIAPEQLNLERTLNRTTKSDVYSFGCIALQVLSGKQPWSEVGEDAAVVLRLAQGHKPERPTSRSIDDPHWNLIQDCWLPVEERPRAERVADAIQQFLSGVPQSPRLRDLLDSK